MLTFDSTKVLSSHSKNGYIQSTANEEQKTITHRSAVACDWESSRPIYVVNWHFSRRPDWC